MSEPWSDQLNCIVRVGIWDDSLPWINTMPPPHKGFINQKGNYTDNWQKWIKSGTATYCLNAIANIHCNWRWVAYRWRMLRYKWDQVTVEEERGVWNDIGHQISFSYGQYHPNFYNITFEVYAEFVFQGTGYLMYDERKRNLLCDQNGNLIIDR